MDNRRNISGVRRLEGQDLDYGDRVYKQRYQQKLWLQQQMQEKKTAQQLQKQEDQRWNQYNSQVRDYWQAEQDLFNQRNQTMRDACKEANLQLIREKKAREQAERAYQMQQAKHDQQFTLTSNLMTENRESMQSMLAPHRVIPYHFKGINEEQKREVIQGQLQQIEENKERKKKEREEQMRDAQLGEAQRRALVMYEREMKMKQDRVNQEQRDYLKTQMLEHQEKYNDPYNMKGPDHLIPLQSKYLALNGLELCYLE